jgi:hypothetical protein
MPKRSTELLADLNETLAQLRGLNAEADEACQPIRRDWRLSDAENRENSRRSARLDELSIELGNAELEAKRLRKAYSDAMAAEQQPPPAAPARSMAEVPKLQKQIGECQKFLSDLPEQRRPLTLPASRGDKKALDALEKIAGAETKALSTIALFSAAIIECEAQNAEERREFVERDAASRFAAAQRIAEEISAHDHSTDTLMRTLAEHLAQRPALLRDLRKCGATFDDVRLGTLSTVEILHRAAKASGLAALLGISVRDAVSLEDASRKLLRLAIRRPAPNSAAA